MSRFSEKLKIGYLLLVILFAFGVFLYLLDTWRVIDLRDYIPFRKKEALLVPDDSDDPGLIEDEHRHKEEERLKELELKLQEMKSKIDADQEGIKKQMEEIELVRKGLEEEKKRLEEQKAAQFERQKTVREMSARLVNMPPDDAVAILGNWSNNDVVDVFLQMEKDAEREGRTSIVPFLMTKLPRERAGLITTMMMDAEAHRVPEQVN